MVLVLTLLAPFSVAVLVASNWAQMGSHVIVSHAICCMPHKFGKCLCCHCYLFGKNCFLIAPM